MATAAEIIVTVRAKIEQFKQSMKEATDSIGANTQGIEQRAAEAGNSFTKGFAKVAGKLSGFNISKILLDGVADATDALNRGEGLKGVVKGFTESVQKSLFAIPVAGQIAKIADNLLNGATRAAEAAFDAITNRFEKAQDIVIDRLRAAQDASQSTEEKIKRMQEDAAAKQQGPEAVQELERKRTVEEEFKERKKTEEQTRKLAERQLDEFNKQYERNRGMILAKYNLDRGFFSRAINAGLSLGTTEIFRSVDEENAAAELQNLKLRLDTLTAGVRTAKIQQQRTAEQETEFAALLLQQQQQQLEQSPSPIAETIADVSESAEETATPMEAVTTGLAEGTQRGGDYDWNNVEQLVKITSEMKRIQNDISKALKKYAPPN